MKYLEGCSGSYSNLTYIIIYIVDQRDLLLSVTSEVRSEPSTVVDNVCF